MHLTHRRSVAPLFGVLLLAAAACDSSNSTAPINTPIAAEAIDIIPDYAQSTTTIMDRAGIGGAQFPDSIALSTEQKASIQLLHDEFVKNNAADLALLQAIEVQAKAARAANKSRDEVRTILEQALPIRARMDARFAALRLAILAIYTPAQRAWIEANKMKECRNGSAPALTEAQLAQLKVLRDGFETANRADIMLLRNIGEQVKEAKKAGKSEAEIRAILATGDAARTRLRAAEKKLYEDIMAILTPEQRNAWCVGRGMRGPGGPIGDG
jgi:Spy/CpxP family protein refolding chaperone